MNKLLFSFFAPDIYREFKKFISEHFSEIVLISKKQDSALGKFLSQSWEYFADFEAFDYSENMEPEIVIELGGEIN